MADTIFALATARGRAGIAVVRVSGPGAFGAAAALAGVRPEPRRPTVRWLRQPADGRRLDEALVLGFAAPASFTGEDVVELQLHGGPAVVRSVLEALAGIDGLRQAEPGEFTRRALVNGRLDLAQVEGLGDLIAAETAAQQRLAVRMLDGALSRLGVAWGEELVRALASIEVGIDFADEELPAGLDAAAREGLGRVAASMDRELAGSRVAERIRDGFEVALVGPPNVGKSTLLNALAGREVALTSELAGTTRDVIEVRLDLDGLALTLLDTAGLRDPGERIEALGIERARRRAAAADLRVFLVDTAGEVAALRSGAAAGRHRGAGESRPPDGDGSAGGLGTDREGHRPAAGGGLGGARRARGSGRHGLARAAARGGRARAGGARAGRCRAGAAGAARRDRRRGAARGAACA